MARLAQLPQMRALPVGARTYNGWSGGLNTTQEPFAVKPSELAGGQDCIIDDSPSVQKRLGNTVYLGKGIATGASRGLFSFRSPTGSTNQRKLMSAVVDGSATKLYHDNAGSGPWTALTNTFSTSANNIEAMVRDDNGAIYFTNGADNIIKWDGTTESTIATAAMKGKYLAYWRGRIISANRASNTNRVDFFDEFSETAATNGFAIVGDENITTLFVYREFLFVGNTKEMYRIEGIDFVNATIGLQFTYVRKLPGVTVGPVSHRTVKKVHGFIYYLGADGHIYKFDGTHSVNISKPQIKRTMDGMSLTRRTSACSESFNNKYYLAIANSGASTNNRIIIYDAVKGIFYTPWTNRSISCFAAFPDANENYSLYGIDESIGRVYQLETGKFDELANQEYATGQDGDTAVDANPATRGAQSFQLNQTGKVTGGWVLMKKNIGTTTELTIRIETNNAGVPSGTLAAADLTTTISSFTDASYVVKTFTFSTPASLTLDTIYWLVVRHTTEGSGTSQYYWGHDASSPGYTRGNGATYASGAWTAQTGRDFLFGITMQQDIDAFFDTKADDFEEPQLRKKVKKIFLFASASGNYDLEVGIANYKFGAFSSKNINLNNIGTTWGGGKKWGEGGAVIWGNQTTVESYAKVPLTAKYFQFRCRNRNDAEPFQVFRLVINFIKLPLLI